MKVSAAFTGGGLLAGLLLAGCGSASNQAYTARIDPSSPVAGATAGPGPTPSPPLPAATAVNSPAPDAGDPVGLVITRLHTLTFETRAGVSAVASELDAQIEAQLNQWRAAGWMITPTADAQLREARANVTEKIAAFTTATPQTWPTVQLGAIDALTHLRLTLEVVHSTGKPQ